MPLVVQFLHRAFDYLAIQQLSAI